MKYFFKISTFLFFAFVVTGCSNFDNGFANSFSGSVSNPLKTKKDIEIEKILSSGTWQYERAHDDCKDTTWTQNFYKNRYYKSVGAACLIPDAFSVDAENWHLKNQTLYVTNLSPLLDDDIILKYGIDYLDKNRLVLSSGKYKYTFNK